MFKKYGPLIILLLLSIAMSIASPFFLAKDNLITIGIQTAVIGVLTIGELLVIITGGIDLAIGSTLALSMVISATMMKVGIPIGLCVVVALLLGAVFGYINGFVVTTMKIPAFIATLGMSGILRGVALMITDGLPISSLPDKVAWFGNGRVFSIPVPVLVLLILAVIFQIVLSKTVFGRQIYALGSNHEATRLAGIPVNARVRYIYMLSGLLASIAGILLMGRLTGAQPTAAIGYESNAIAASVIGGASMLGGIGTVWGAIVGAFIMNVLTNGLTLLHVNTFFQQSAIGFILIMAVYIDIMQRTNNVNLLKSIKKLIRR
ncbi:MAG TPA: ABC transporter permease [Candidatus Pelethocola excrementipullorum]|nr:ABC transporter permease [Candidatus Pelethocola excrementipullorum]